MKKGLLFSLLVVSFLVVPFSAGAYTIDDTGDAAYWGGTVMNAPSSNYYGDVIGAGFNVDSLEATTSGYTTTFTLQGEYFSNRNDSRHLTSEYGPGDLYISSKGWNVSSGSAPHYTSDTFSQAEGWDYVISIQDQKVYRFDPTKDDYAVTNPGSGRENWSYRDEQAWRGGYGEEVTDVVVDVRFEGDTLIFTLTFADGSIFDFNVDEIGYHWTMMCGNDIVEGGKTPVPEPATMFLLGFGLLGLGLARKKLTI